MSGIIQKPEAESAKRIERPQFVDNMLTIEKNNMDKYSCIKCSNLVRIPVKQLYCGHSICGLCLFDILSTEDSTRCPGNEERCLKTDLQNATHVVPAFFIQHQLENMTRKNQMKEVHQNNKSTQTDIESMSGLNHQKSHVTRNVHHNNGHFPTTVILGQFIVYLLLYHLYILGEWGNNNIRDVSEFETQGTGPGIHSQAHAEPDWENPSEKKLPNLDTIIQNQGICCWKCTTNFQNTHIQIIGKAAQFITSSLNKLKASKNKNIGLIVMVMM